MIGRIFPVSFSFFIYTSLGNPFKLKKKKLIAVVNINGGGTKSIGEENIFSIPIKQLEISSLPF